MAVDIWNLAIRSAMIWDYLFIRNSSKKWPTYSGYSLLVSTFFQMFIVLGMYSFVPKLKLKSWMDPNLHLHSCYRKCTMDYRHLWFSNNPCNISFSFWPSNPHCLPRIWTFGFDIFWPVYLWSIWWWLPIRPELHELQPRINN